MTRVCYWCNKCMGEKEGNGKDGVFHSICDECADKMGLEERLPELLWAIADLRKQGGGNGQHQTLDLLATAQYSAEPIIAQ